LGEIEMSKNANNHYDTSKERTMEIEKEFLDAGWEKVVIGATVILQSPTHSHKEVVKERKRSSSRES
jgi:hypothetical protein